MKLNTTAARGMSPPVVIVECPGDGGHPWAKINPKWMAEKPGRSRPPHPRERFWCPDHQEEKKAHVSKVLSENAIKTARAYSSMPLPATRRCTNKNPGTHDPGAVLPSGKFYRVKRRRTDGTHSETLDSICKECKRAQNRAYAATVSKDDLRRKRRRYERNWRERRQEALKRIQFERDHMLPITPFKLWLEGYIDNSLEDISKIEERAGLGVTTLNHILTNRTKKYTRMSTIDQTGVACGYPDLLWQLYPIEDQVEAA